MVRETEEQYLKVVCASKRLEKAHASIRRLAECNFADETTSQSLEQHAEASAQTLIDLRVRVATWENVENENRNKARVRAAEVAAVLRGEEEEETSLGLSLMRAEERLSVKEALSNVLSPDFDHERCNYPADIYIQSLDNVEFPWHEYRRFLGAFVRDLVPFGTTCSIKRSRVNTLDMSQNTRFWWYI